MGVSWWISAATPFSIATAINRPTTPPPTPHRLSSAKLMTSCRCIRRKHHPQQGAQRTHNADRAARHREEDGPRPQEYQRQRDGDQPAPEPHQEPSAHQRGERAPVPRRKRNCRTGPAVDSPRAFGRTRQPLQPGRPRTPRRRLDTTEPANCRAPRRERFQEIPSHREPFTDLLRIPG